MWIFSLPHVFLTVAKGRTRLLAGQSVVLWEVTPRDPASSLLLQRCPRFLNIQHSAFNPFLPEIQ